MKWTKLFLTSVSSIALTTVVIHHLDTAVCSHRITRVRETLVDVSLTPRPHIAGSAVTTVAINLLYAGAPMKTSPYKAVLLI